MNQGGRVDGARWWVGESPARDRAVLLLVAAVLFFWRLGSHDLRPPDELRFGLVAKEMWESGDYSLLSRNDRLYTDKPPLFFWAINGFALLFGGVNEWSVRLPSALAALLALEIIYRLGRRLYDRRTGLLGALIFATSIQILVRGRWASIDMTLNLFVLAAIVLLWNGAERGEGRWRERLAWCAMALATLAKGPVGVVLPLLAVTSALVLQGRYGAIRRLFPPSGVMLFLSITLAWFVVFMQRLGPGAALEVLTHQTVDRYVDAWNVRHPVWYYLWRFPVGFFPWIIFLPGAAARAFRRPEPEDRRAALMLAAWFAAIFVFFSLSTGKRGVYLVPLYPAAALLVARLFVGAAGGRDAAHRAGGGALRIALALWSVLAAGLAVALPIAALKTDPNLVFAASLIGAVLLLGAVGAILLHRRGHASGAAASLCGSLILMALCGTELVLPELNRRTNIRGFAERVGAQLRPDIPFGATEGKREAWVFYTGRFAHELDTREQILEYMGGNPPRDLLIGETELQSVQESLPPGTEEILHGRVSGESFHLLRLGERP